jgi:hypothetical protein
MKECKSFAKFVHLQNLFIDSDPRHFLANPGDLWVEGVGGDRILERESRASLGKKDIVKKPLIQ